MTSMRSMTTGGGDPLGGAAPSGPRGVGGAGVIAGADEVATGGNDVPIVGA
jgi:hypothetical protein